MKKLYILIPLLTLLLIVFSLPFIPKSFQKTEESSFVIEKGNGLREISSNLKDQGYIRNDLLFNVYSYLTGNSKKIQSGNYEISSSMVIPEIVHKFSSGDVVKEKLTIIEGWTLEDILSYLEDKDIFEENIKDTLYSNGRVFNYDFLDNGSFTLEGYVFPDTYYLSKGDTFNSFLDLTFQNFEKKIDKALLSEIETQGKSLHEIIIMASLIEREVKTYEDKQLVSGVLWNRESIGMALQSCSTVTYLTGKETVSTENTKIDSPYNTYLYLGLPIGPISNPGLDSIKAAIYPQESDYLYFLSTSDGKTIFSKTLKEHNIAKAEYLK
jgi:UPF0755 protein